MSRTYRKPYELVSESRSDCIARSAVMFHRQPYRVIRKRKTQEEYERDIRLAELECRERILANNNSSFVYVYIPSIDYHRRIAIWPRYVSPFHIEIQDLTLDDVVQEQFEHRRRLERDGQASPQSKYKKFFKRQKNKKERLESREFCRRAQREEDVDDLGYPVRRGESWYWDY